MQILWIGSTLQGAANSYNLHESSLKFLAKFQRRWRLLATFHSSFGEFSASKEHCWTRDQDYFFSLVTEKICCCALIPAVKLLWISYRDTKEQIDFSHISKIQLHDPKNTTLTSRRHLASEKTCIKKMRVEMAPWDSCIKHHDVIDFEGVYWVVDSFESIKVTYIAICGCHSLSIQCSRKYRRANVAKI